MYNHMCNIFVYCTSIETLHPMGVNNSVQLYCNMTPGVTLGNN